MITDREIQQLYNDGLTEVADEILGLRDALDHIARIALGSRNMTKRTAWIVQRAKSALNDNDDWRAVKKPKGYHDAINMTHNNKISGAKR